MLNRREFIAACATLPFIGGPAGASERVTWHLPAHMPVKVLLDTDIGSDIDDAVALAYLLREPRCHLMGITTVSGEARKRAQLATALCQASGKNIPVYCGLEDPLVIDQKQPGAPQAEKLDDAMTRIRFNARPMQAIEFMRDTILANPGEIVLLAVGPMTNLATLFSLDPEIPSLLKSVVVMAGKYSNYPTPWGPTEWNAICDPHAMSKVFNAAVGNITAFGLDITWQVSMTPEDIQQRFQVDPLLRIVETWSEVWFKERSLLHFHDPLAAAAIFEPDVCEYIHGDVTVDFSTPEAAGITHFTPTTNGAVRIARRVNPERFFESYFRPFQSLSSKIGAT